MQKYLKSKPTKQRGAFLVIAMILLIVLSAIGIATMSMATSAIRISHNYSNYIQAQIKAFSMMGYGKRILETFTDGVYFGPGTCTTTSTCNVIDNTFPMNGRPLLPWSSGLSGATLFSSAQTDAWWSLHAFAYEGTFAGASGNARVIVQWLGADTANSPYPNTYLVVGYGTDPETGGIRATNQMYHVWNSYPVDPGSGTCATNCHYATCCPAGGIGACAGDATTCQNGTATYVPPGWNCTQYFVTGLGYTSGACTTPVCPPGQAVCTP